MDTAATAMTLYQVDKKIQSGGPRWRARGEGLMTRMELGTSSPKRSRWSMKPTARASQRFLNDVARYCADRPAWGPAARNAIVAAVPALATPIDRLELAIEDLTTDSWETLEPLAASRSEAARAHALKVASGIAAGYRAYPFAPALMPMPVRLTTAQRVKGLVAAVARFDALVQGWYEFAFTSTAPADRNEQLAALADLYPVSDQAASCEVQRQRCEAQRVRCEAQGPQAVLTPSAARAIAGDLRTALDKLEHALHQAVMATPPRQLGPG
ncbi:MAG TPA: hypothetical protein VK507_17535 [Iamia sp.]|nr:hypothetical protein [Iamia sp.]